MKKEKEEKYLAVIEKLSNKIHVNGAETKKCLKGLHVIKQQGKEVL